MNNIDSSTGEIVMYQPDETIRLEVRMGEETVWLSQAQMAELFGTKRQAITKHLQNIDESDELKKEATSSILELVRREGNRTVKRKVEFYNLDAIISVSSSMVRSSMPTCRLSTMWYISSGPASKMQARNSSLTSKCMRPQQRNC